MIKVDGVVELGTKSANGEYSDSDDDPEVQQKQKELLFDWIVHADFQKEFSLARITSNRFRLDPEELATIKNFEDMAKIVKVLVYKIGLTYKRQDLFRDELVAKLEDSEKAQVGLWKQEISSLNNLIASVTDELQVHTNRQKGFRDVTIGEL